jgi:peptide/nickel transport system substrate-binding protein
VKRTWLAMALLVAACAADAATLRWSSQGDYLTADPHAQNEGLNNTLNGQVYEQLVLRGKNLELVPGLAMSWVQASPTSWRFNLRRDVRFHDGTRFTADDVVFSVDRARQEGSTFRVFAHGVGHAIKVDDYTVSFETTAPQPVMLEMLGGIFIMSKAWCQRHGAMRPQDFRARQETWASRNANGTGPFVLVSREPDVRSDFRKNPAWWGLAEPGRGNVEAIVYRPIKDPRSRVAALLAGDVDLVIDPPLHQVESLREIPGIRVLDGVENRVIFFGFDQSRAELLNSSVKGRNPFKDVRVRLAFYKAIDVEALQRTIMRGYSRPTGVLLPNPLAAGIPARVDWRHDFDPAAARSLLSAAGFADGFDLSIDCPSNRYLNDERICTAVATMLSRIGVRATVNAMPWVQYFPKILRRDASMYLLGVGGPNTDPLFTFLQVIRQRNATGDGDLNLGGHADPALDALIDAARIEIDPARRRLLVEQVVEREREFVYHVPIHRQVIPWASRGNVDAIHRADNWLQATWVTIK